MTTSKKSGWLAGRVGNEDFERLLAREDFIEDFLSAVEDAMAQQRVTRAELARRMKCAPANVTQLFRRTRNLTAATMVDIAFHLGLSLKLQLAARLPGEARWQGFGARDWAVRPMVHTHATQRGCAAEVKWHPRSAASADSYSVSIAP